MKKIKLILLIVITILLSSCYNDRNPDGSYIIHTDGYPYGLVSSVTLIDENGEKCEYILYDHGITHKGNCKYCKERRDKEKEQ